MSSGERIINIPTNNRKIYKHVLLLMNFGMNLTTKEIDVLAEFVRLNNEYNALPAEQRSKFIFSTDMRKEVMDILGIEEGSLNNILSRLRKATFLGKPILSQDNQIVDDLLFKPGEHGFNIKVFFTI